MDEKPPLSVGHQLIISKALNELNRRSFATWLNRHRQPARDRHIYRPIDIVDIVDIVDLSVKKKKK